MTMEKNYKLTIAYDGTRFYGWERQPDRDTIQGRRLDHQDQYLQAHHLFHLHGGSIAL